LEKVLLEKIVVIGLKDTVVSKENVASKQELNFERRETI
jgi:hypothetical protein